MATFRFDEDSDGVGTRMAQVTSVTQLFIRAVGVLLMLLGLFVAMLVIIEAWGLYSDPDRIESFAEAVERGSNLDSALRPQIEDDSGTAPVSANDLPVFSLSYFAAWVIVILLLMLIGRLAITAVRVGGELALYDVKIKKFARELISSGGQFSSNR